VDHCCFTPRRLEDRKKARKVWEVCERIFTCNFLVKDGLAAPKQAERTRQPKPGSDVQMRRTGVLGERISRPTEHRKPSLARG
jgi:hypothetical protein